MKAFIVKLFATGLYTGLSPAVPGTVGTLPAWVLVWFLFGYSTTVAVIATVILFLVSVWLSTEAESVYGHDSKKIVIDEWAGMAIAVLFVKHTLTAYLIAFVAFRLFDVVKLPPAAQSEKLPAGWGVTMDDVVAGVQANILTQIILFALDRF
ncbi:MAG: phosphatidylglycerophosphatase A [Candidatus Zixiibacteriota bacterium]